METKDLEKTDYLFKVVQQADLDLTLIWLQSPYSLLTDDSTVWVQVFH